MDIPAGACSSSACSSSDGRIVVPIYNRHRRPAPAYGISAAIGSPSPPRIEVGINPVGWEGHTELLTAIDEYRQRRQKAAGFIKWSRTTAAHKSPAAWVKVLEAEVEDLTTAFEEEKNQVVKAHATISAMQRLNIETRKAGPQRLEDKPGVVNTSLGVQEGSGLGDNVLKCIMHLDQKLVKMEDAFLEDDRKTFFFLEEQCTTLTRQLEELKDEKVEWEKEKCHLEGDNDRLLDELRRSRIETEHQRGLLQSRPFDVSEHDMRESQMQLSRQNYRAEIDHKTGARTSCPQLTIHTMEGAPERSDLVEVNVEPSIEASDTTAVLAMLTMMDAKLAAVESEQTEETEAIFFFYEGELERLREEIAGLRASNLDMKAALEERKEEEAALRLSMRHLQRQMEVKNELDAEKLDVVTKTHNDKVNNLSIEIKAMKVMEEEVSDLRTHVAVLMSEKCGFKAMAEAAEERRKAAERRMQEAEKKVEQVQIRTLLDEAHQRGKKYNQVLLQNKKCTVRQQRACQGQEN